MFDNLYEYSSGETVDANGCFRSQKDSDLMVLSNALDMCSAFSEDWKL